MAKITNQSTLTSRYQLPDSSQQENESKSNIVSTENMTTSFLKERESAKTFGLPNDEILQTIKLTNNSDYPISNCTVTDTISAGASFKAGTVTVDGVTRADDDPTVGITLGSDLAPTKVCTIQYTLLMADEPAGADVTVTSEVSYDAGGQTGLIEDTNETTIEVESQKVVIEKSADKQAVIAGETITYTHIIKNEGSLKNVNLFFKDEIPIETQFVSNSVTIDGTPQTTYDPVTGFALDDLEAGQSITVEFRVNVIQ